MKNKNQSGNAHAMIVIILVIALIGSLGFIFWQNFAKNETGKQNQNSQTDKNNRDNNPKTDNNKTEIELSEIAADDTVGTNLAIKYPKTWTMTHSEKIEPNINGPVLLKGYKISSPDGKVYINFIVTNIGGGGMCDAEPGREITQFERSNIPGFKKALFISYSDNSGTFFAGVQNNNSKTQSAKVGDSSCSTVTFGFPSGLISEIPNTKAVNAGMQLAIEFDDLQHNGTSESSAKFRQYLDTDNYKTAKSIIESLYVKD